MCLLLPIGAGRAAESLLSRGVDFSGVTLAVCAAPEDDTAGLLVEYMGVQEDIAQYCKMVPMELGEALDALRSGEVTAVLDLPENFVRGVMYGENPDLRLIVDGERPLESLLLLWVGQSAADILSAAQSGVYAVLDLYEQSPPPGLDWNRAMVDINLRYINLTLDRVNFYRIQKVSATRALPIPLHYGLSLLAYFALSTAPLFLPVYSGGWLRFQRRLRGAGRGCGAGLAAGACAGAPMLLLLLAPGLLAAGKGHPLAVLGAAALMAVYCSLFCALCCLAAGSAARCGALTFLISLLSLALGGGIVPPVLLPAALGRLSWLSPVTWLRELAAWPMGYDAAPTTWICLALSGAAMALACVFLYRRGVDREEEEP